MKRTMAAAAVCLLLAGCGGDDNAEPPVAAGTSAGPTATAPPTEQSSPEPAVASEEQLRAALVTQADLPPGYVEVPPTGEEDPPVQGQTPECTERFAVLSGMEDNAVATAEVAFDADEGAASLEHSWQAYESAEQLNSELDALEAVFVDCPVLVLEEEGQQFELTVAPLEVPPVGERTAAYLATAEVQGVPIELAFHFSVVGNQGQSVTQGGLGEADVDLLAMVASLGVERLDA